MSTDLRTVAFSVELVLRVVCLVFCCWITLEAHTCVVSLLTKQRERERSHPQRSQSSSQRTGRFLALSTLSAILCFTLVNLVNVPFICLYLAKVPSTQRKRSLWRQPPLSAIWAVGVASISLISLSLFLLTLVGMERLIATFEHTQHRIHDCIVKIARLSLAMVPILQVPGIVVYYVMSVNSPNGLAVYLSLSLMAFLLYLCLNIWIIINFFSKTMSVSKRVQRESSLEAVNPAVSNQSEDDSHHVSNSKGSKLTRTAIRMTLCTGLPLFTSLCFGFFYTVALGFRGSLLYFVVRITAVLDLAFNCWCLLLTFNQAAELYYDRVFGLLHEWVHSRII